MAQSDDKFQTIQEAKRHLEDIERVIQMARTYLKFLEDVANFVAVHLEEDDGSRKGDLPQPPTVPQLSQTTTRVDVGVVLDYLSNLTRACSMAENYLNHLEGVVATVEDYLNRCESDTMPDDEQQETIRTKHLLSDLQETIGAVNQHLMYLKGVASAVDDYLEDPIHKPLPPELANLELASAAVAEPTTDTVDAFRRSIPAPSTPTEYSVRVSHGVDRQVPSEPIGGPPVADSRTPTTATTGGGTASYLDSLTLKSSLPTDGMDDTSSMHDIASAPTEEPIAAVDSGVPYFDQLSSASKALDPPSGDNHAIGSNLEDRSAAAPASHSLADDDGIGLSTNGSVSRTTTTTTISDKLRQTQETTKRHAPSPTSVIISSKLGDLVATLCCPRLMYSIYSNSKTTTETSSASTSLDRKKCPCGAFTHCVMPTILYSGLSLAVETSTSETRPLLLSPSTNVRLSDVQKQVEHVERSGLPDDSIERGN